MAETDKEVNGDKLKEDLKTLLEQNNSLFKQQTKGITTYQLNFISLLCKGIHSKFITQAVSEIYPLNSKSYVNLIKKQFFTIIKNKYAKNYVLIFISQVKAIPLKTQQI